MKVALWCLDFGGVVDSDGVHTRVQYWDAVMNDSRGRTRHEFQEAYTLADQRLLKTGQAEHSGLFDLNVQMFQSIARELRISDSVWVVTAAVEVTRVQAAVIELNQKVIQSLSKIAPVVMVSNFTGNLKIILDEFKILSFVSGIVESFHETRLQGEVIQKPDIRMFQSALKYLPATELTSAAVMVGDNYERDLKPASLLGMQTVWIAPDQCPNLRRLEETLQTRNPNTVQVSSTQR